MLRQSSVDENLPRCRESDFEGWLLKITSGAQEMIDLTTFFGDVGFSSFSVWFSKERYSRNLVDPAISVDHKSFESVFFKVWLSRH